MISHQHAPRDAKPRKRGSARLSPKPAIAWAQRPRTRGISPQDITDRSGVSVTLARRLLHGVNRPNHSPFSREDCSRWRTAHSPSR